MSRTEDTELLIVASERLRALIAAAGDLAWSTAPVTSTLSQIVHHDTFMGRETIAERVSPERAELIVAAVRASAEVLGLLDNARLLSRLDVIPETVRADLARGLRLAHAVTDKPEH